jgi:amidase
VRPFLEEVGDDPGRLRIAFTTETTTGFALEPDCVEAVRDAAQLCASLGHEVGEAPLGGMDGDVLSHAFEVIWACDTAKDIATRSLLVGRAPGPDELEPLTWALAERARKYSGADVMLALEAFQEVARILDFFFTAYDLLLTCTLGEPPVPLGTFEPTPDDPLAGYRRAEKFVPYTPIANLSGQPAMSVPLFWNQQGLPIGVHFVARFGDEATLFRLAAQLEQARPWAHRRPPVFAS